ncbi:hypothetical protein G6F43_007845 [Rhizopus delemar]|nr:hypothetical protein G6F43_007845 [Rhizopus delemar]
MVVTTMPLIARTGNFKTPAMWIHYLQENFHNCLQTHDLNRLPTFQQNTSIHSSIDYIYTSLPLQHLLTESSLSYLDSSCSIGYRSPVGHYQSGSLSPQDQWELVKTVAIKTVKTFGVKYVCWRQQSLKYLQRKRNRLLRSKPPVATLEHFLPKIEKMIKMLQAELVEGAALTAGMVWREQGERSAKFLKNVHQRRENQQYIGTLQPTAVTQNPPSTSERTEHPPSSTASSDPATSLTEPISIEDLIEQASRNGNKISSPGFDGLGYPFLLHLFRHPRLQELSVHVYNQAMQGVFPSTWQDLRVRLLPKKGDLSTLKNWRPISLINCDAKIFTRILTKRLGLPLGKLLNHFQLGFVPGKFIADNGMAFSLILEQARGFRLPGVGLLLDQEKAYDRVHPGYLRSVMAKFNFPAQFIKCISKLFFGNQVSININGFFTDPINQQRGLRQGDPLSPLLFNIALEPFLLSLIQDPQLHGISLSPSPTGVFSLNSSSVPLIICLAYADDVYLLLSNPTELRHTSIHMRNYAAVSNAKFNDNKTEVFSLQDPWDHTWGTPLHDMSITTFHHQGSNQLILKVQQQCILYHQKKEIYLI